MKLKVIKKKNSGRDASGKVVVRHQGGQHKRFVRLVDYKRLKTGVSGKVIGIEYDPNRSADLALIQDDDGEKRYILRPNGLELEGIVASGENADVKPGNTLPLKSIPVGTLIHNVELAPGRGGQIARGAGTAVTIQAIEGKFAHIKMPSGEIRKISIESLATIGQVGNMDWKNRVIGKAGRSRNMGIRPTVRGTAQNPRSHPHGGGEARSGIGLKYPKAYTGRRAVGNTRKKHKYSDKYILQRRSH